MLLSYEKQDECFKLFTTEESILTISQQSLAHYVSPYVANDLFEVETMDDFQTIFAKKKTQLNRSLPAVRLECV